MKFSSLSGEETSDVAPRLGLAVFLSLVPLGFLVAPFLLVGQSQSAPGRNPPQAGGFVVRAQTNLVLVDVRVWDKGGRAVTDLKPEHFRVFEDGNPQEITSFSLENVERLSQATAENGPPPTIDLRKLPPGLTPAKAVEDRRLIVLFFDLTSMPVDDLMRALKGASDFVSSQMTPADLVSLVTYTSRLHVVQNFTNNRAALQATVRAIRVGESSSLSEAGAQGEPGTTNASGEQVVAQDVSAAFTPVETEFNIFNTDEKLAAIESLSRMLGDVPGRKVVIHFSSGTERTGIENQAQLRAAVDAANRANVSLYTLDARGLMALVPGGDATAASPAGTAVYHGQAVFSQVSSLQGSRETLASLAADTGGRAFTDLNDFSHAFRQVQSENSSYYLLGYSPANTRADGRFRRIRVEVDRRGVKVEARPGYFAPKDFRQFNREDKELQLQQALDLDAPFVDLPLAVETAFFRRPDRKFYVLLAAKIPGSALSFLSKSGRHETQFDFLWRATDPTGRAAGLLRDTLPVKLSGETYQRVIRGNVLYEGGFVLPPGKYGLKVVVRETHSGKLGTFEQTLSLPEEAEASLAMSSVVLSNELQDLAAASDVREPKKKTTSERPLQVGSRAVLPSVTRVFRTNQNLYVYVESYSGRGNSGSVAPGSESRPSPAIAVVFFRGGVKVAEAGPFPGKRENAPLNRALYFVQMPLGKFPPGRYWMQVNVLDAAADRVAFSRVPLAIVRPPASSPAPRAGS